MTMEDSQKMLEIWHKWKKEIIFLGTDLAVTSAMNEWFKYKVKNLNLHSVENKEVVVCKYCGCALMWNEKNEMECSNIHCVQTDC